MNKALKSKNHTLSGLVRVFERLDTILAGTKVNVTLGYPSSGAPAWTSWDASGPRIFINKESIDDTDLETLVNLQGLNYHELSHVMYTPSTPISQHRQASNILEDQRIESLLVSRFPDTAKYLTAIISRWVLGDRESMDRALLLLRGRQYLPLELRKSARLAYHKQEDVEEICDIIDEYRVLKLDTREQLKRASDLTDRFARILGDDPLSGCGTSGGTDDASRGFSGVVPSPPPEVEDKADDPADAPEGEPGGEPGGDPGERFDDKSPEDALEDALEDAIRDVMSDRNVIKDTIDKRNQARNGDTHYEEETRSREFRSMPLTPEAKLAARRFEEELRRLSTEAEAGWDRRTPSGRLNVDRWISGCAPEEAFDRWDEGMDGYDLDVVTLIDTSGSMCGEEQGLSECAWSVDRAVKSIEASSRVYTFDSNTNLAYAVNERSPADPKRLHISGNTNAWHALEIAEDTLTTSKRSNKLVIVVTDGEWADREDCDATIARIQARGGTVAIAYVNTGYFGDSEALIEERHRHGAKYFAQLTSTSDLPRWARGVIDTVTKDRRPL